MADSLPPVPNTLPSADSAQTRSPHAGAASILQDLQLRYVHAIDDDALESWPEFFGDPCLYRITHRLDERAGRAFGMIYADSKAMLRDRVSSLRDVNIYEAQTYRHIINPPLVTDVNDTHVRATTSFIVVRTMQTGEMTVFAAGLYRDVVEMTGTHPVFVEKTVVLDSPAIDTLLALPL